MIRILPSFVFALALLTSLVVYSSPARDVVPLQSQALLYVDSVGDERLDLSLGYSALLQDYDFFSLNGVINLGYKQQPHWLVVEVPKESQTGEWWLEYGYPLMDSVKVFVSIGGGSWQKIGASGDIQPRNTRQYFSPRFYFLLPPDSTHVMLRLQTLGSMQLPIRLVTSDRLVVHTNIEQFSHGLFFGALLIMIFYNLFIYTMSRDVVQLLYVGFIAAITLFNLSVTGYGGMYLWPDHGSWVNQHIQPMSVGLSLLFVMLFTRRVLQIRAINKNLDKVLLLQGLLSIGLVLGGGALPYSVMAQATAIWPIIVVLTIVYAGFVASRQRQQGSFIFLLAWGAGLLGALLFSAQMQGWIPSNLVTQNGLKVGIILNVTLLSFSLVSNIKKLKQEKASLEKEAQDNYQLALVDSLTGVPNRRAFDERLSVELERCHRDKSNIALLMIDVDYFKNFNDTYGHQLGDDTLIRVALIMRNCLRRPTDMLFRYGGEEFSVILADTDNDGAVNMANRIKDSIEGLCIPHQESPFKQVTVSIGLAVSETASIISEDFIQFADEALYKAKGQGRNQMVYVGCDHTSVVNIGDYFKNTPKDTL